MGLSQRPRKPQEPISHKREITAKNLKYKPFHLQYLKFGIKVIYNRNNQTCLMKLSIELVLFKKSVHAVMKTFNLFHAYAFG